MDSNKHAPTTMDREDRKSVALKTRRIISDGIYEGPGGLINDISSDVSYARKNTTSFGPVKMTGPQRGVRSLTAPKIWTERVDTLVAAERMVKAGGRPAVLNFASAKNPGGGWERGATGQEESLSRRSALVATLEGNSEYADTGENTLYRSWVIYSPDVPVIRDGHEILLDTPWKCSFLTCPAPNLEGKLSEKLLGTVDRVLRQRIDMILRVASIHGHRRLVLGAWGCGVFKNNPKMVALAFKSLLDEYNGYFQEVVFAILGSDETYQPFAKIFGGA